MVARRHNGNTYQEIAVVAAEPLSVDIKSATLDGSVTVDGKAYEAAATITRPSDSTAYAAGDVVGDAAGSAIITLANIGPSNGFVLIHSVALLFSDSSVPANMAAFRVHFYTSSPTAIVDNAAFDLVGSDRARYAGFVELSKPLALGSSLYQQNDPPARMVRLLPGSTSLFALIETRGGYQPVSGSTVRLSVSALEVGL